MDAFLCRAALLLTLLAPIALACESPHGLGTGTPIDFPMLRLRKTFLSSSLPKKTLPFLQPASTAEDLIRLHPECARKQIPRCYYFPAPYHFPSLQLNLRMSFRHKLSPSLGLRLSLVPSLILGLSLSPRLRTSLRPKGSLSLSLALWALVPPGHLQMIPCRCTTCWLTPSKKPTPKQR